ncbi:MAG: hypothetical protein AAFO15_00545 [Pseudomonadota bacterium]
MSSDKDTIESTTYQKDASYDQQMDLDKKTKDLDTSNSASNELNISSNDVDQTDKEDEVEFLSPVNPNNLSVVYQEKKYQYSSRINPDSKDIKYFDIPNTIVVYPFHESDSITWGNLVRRKALNLPSIRIYAMYSTDFVHTYSSVHGITESVSDIILNLKEVVFKNNNGKYVDINFQCRISKNTKGSVLAGDIELDDPNIEIVNKNHVICNIVSDIDLDVILYVRSGHGYVVSSAHRTHHAVLDKLNNIKDGVIYFDIAYNNSININFTTNPFIPPEDSSIDIKYQKLEEVVFTISTDGSITAKDVFGIVLRMVSEQTARLIKFARIADTNAPRRNTMQLINLLSQKLEDNKLFSQCYRLVRVLIREGYIKIIDIIRLTPQHIGTMARLGGKTACEFERIMLQLGFVLQKYPDGYIWELKNE